MPENWSWRTRQLLTCRCVSVMLLRSMRKYTKELADAKAENDALRDDVAAGRRRLHIKAVCQSVREATIRPPAWIMQPPPTGRHRWTGIISPSERGWSLCKKQLEGTQKYINEQCSIELPISMGNSCNYCEQYTRASSGIMFKVSNRAIHLRMFAGFVLTTFSCRHKFWLWPTVFFPAQFQKRRNDGAWFPCATAAGLFWTVNVCWAHPVISRASAVASSIFFMVLFPMLFEVRAESYV